MLMEKKSCEKLREILRDTGWSQDELARRLEVPQKTLNFWINEKSTPRDTNIAMIDLLYRQVVGRDFVDDEELENAISQAMSKKISLREFLENTEILDTTILHLTYHTNTIEGSTMTLSDVEKVLNDENSVLTDRTVREQTEARNHRAAFLFLLDELKKQGKDFRWTSDLIKNVHLRLMNGILESSGQYRNYGVRIMGSMVPLSNHLSIGQKIEDLVAYMNETDDDLITKLSKTHARFEQIHPFGDGNGRTGRLIMFAQAIQSGIVPPLVLKERKQAYYRCLRKAQMEDDFSLLELFVAESILTTAELIK